ncbi:MAG: hypothetical protein BWY10_02405 [Chloroflexi bacterium ADurb.Bin180]|nr:MAG: hypothetical protein BWY10_02405 [Chloroflexi bacterium ADurb.Bin180]
MLNTATSPSASTAGGSGQSSALTTWIPARGSRMSTVAQSYGVRSTPASVYLVSAQLSTPTLAAMARRRSVTVTLCPAARGPMFAQSSRPLARSMLVGAGMALS